MDRINYDEDDEGVFDRSIMNNDDLRQTAVYEVEDKQAELSEMDFEVKNPHDNNGHIVYETIGHDTQGDWTINRRFNDFHVLRQIL